MVENMRNFHKKESLDALVKELQNIWRNPDTTTNLFNITSN